VVAVAQALQLTVRIEPQSQPKRSPRHRASLAS
jgi:hypothetical protein